MHENPRGTPARRDRDPGCLTGGLSAELNAKSVRRALATIGEHGPDGVSVIVQGKLVGDTITEAGIFAQPKAKPAAEAA